jgi:type II secretory pathway pseudopilin PulG
MSILLFEIVLLVVGIAIAVAAMVWDRWSVAREEARAAVRVAECLVREQATGCRTGGPRPPASPSEPLAAWVDDAVLRALKEL